MATLAISINLDQVREAQTAFQQIMSKFHMEAVSAMHRIQSEFDKELKFGGFQRSLQGFINILGKFTEAAVKAFGTIRGTMQTPPDMSAWRTYFNDLRVEMGRMVTAGRQTFRTLQTNVGSIRQSFTPQINIQQVIDARIKYEDIMGRFYVVTQRNVQKMIREFDKLITVINQVQVELRLMVGEFNQALSKLGPLGQVFNAVAKALKEIAAQSRAAGAGVAGVSGSMKGMTVVAGQNNTVIGSFNRNMQQAAQNAHSAARGTHQYRDSLLGLFFLVDKMNVSALWDKVKTFSQGLMETQRSMDTTMATLRVAFQTAQQAAIEYERVRELSERIGVNTLATAEAWARVSAAAAKSEVFGEQAWSLFSGVMKASAVLGRDPEGALRAVEQIFSKAQLSMEEVRQQMSERLPGSVKIFEDAARNLGTTFEEVVRQTGTGVGKMAALVGEAGRIMNERFGKEAEANARRLAGAIENLGNAWQEMQNNINQGGFNQALVDALKVITDFFREEETMVAMRALGKALGSLIPDMINRYLIPALKFLRENLDSVIETLVLLTFTFTGLMKGGLIGLALAPFTGGASIPIAAGIGAAAGFGIGSSILGGSGFSVATTEVNSQGQESLTLVGELFDLVKQVVGALIKVFSWLWDALKPLEDLANRGLDWVHRLFGGTPEVASGIPVPVKQPSKGFSETFQETLPEARAEIERQKKAREDAARGALPFPTTEVTPPGPTKEMEALRKRTEEFIRKQEAQIKEMSTLMNGVQTISVETISTAMSNGMVMNGLQQKIHAAAAKVGIDPFIFEAIVKQESNYNPRAVSRAGARGLTQLMPGTAAEMGVTDRFDVDQSLAGGAGYFAKLLKMFRGDYRLAILAYNAGPGRVQGMLRAGGNERMLPAETQAYLPAVMGHDAQLRAGGGATAARSFTTQTLGTAVTSQQFATLRRNAELMRQAEANQIDVSDSPLGQKTRKAMFEAADAVETVTRFLGQLKEVEDEETKAKDLMRLSNIQYTEELIRGGADLEAYTMFVQRSQEIEKQFGPLLDDSSSAIRNHVNRLKEATQAIVDNNRAKEAAISLSEGFRENIFLKEEADLRRQLALRKMVTVQMEEGTVAARNRAEALAFLQARQEIVQRAGGDASVLEKRTNIFDANGNLVAEGKTVGQMSDLRVREQLDAQRSIRVSDTIRSLEQEKLAQEDLIDVVNMGTRERERELAFREELNRQQADGNELTSEEIRLLRESTDALVDKQEKARNMYGPLKRFAEEFANDIENLQNVIVDAFSGMEDAIAEFAATGKFNISDLVQSMIRDLTKLALRQAITGPLANWINNSLPTSGQAPGVNAGQNTGIGGGWGSWISGAAKLVGGLLGRGGAGANLPASVPFMGMPEYHGGIIGASRYAFGGVAGVDTVPAWLTRGEGVFTPDQMRHLAPVDAQRRPQTEQNVTINNNFNIENSNADSFRRSTPQIEAQMTNSSRRSWRRLGRYD